MMPLIIVTTDKKAANKFVKEFIKDNKFSAEKVIEIAPLKSEIIISQIRLVRKELAISSALPRLFIFRNFDKATAEAQNAILKSLEEAAAKNQFILIVENEYLLLNTIRSRSTIKYLGERVSADKKVDEISEILEKAEQSADFRFLSEATLTGSSRDDVIKFFNSMILYYRTKLSLKAEFSQIIKKAMTLKSLLESNNLNPQLTYDNLLLFINKVSKMKK